MGFGVQAEATIAHAWSSVGAAAASPSIRPRPLEFTDNAPNSRFPEINCIRGLLAPDVLAAAEQRAVRLGVGADRVLIAAGALSEETYLRALCTMLGVEFEPVEDVSRAQRLIDHERLIKSAATGLLPLTTDDDFCLVVAPRGTAARRIIHLIEDDRAWARRFRFTSAERSTVWSCATRAQPSPRGRRTNSRKIGRCSPPCRPPGAEIYFRSHSLDCYHWRRPSRHRPQPCSASNSR